MNKIAAFIIDTLTTKYGFADDEVFPDSVFEDLGIDSLTILELLVMLEGRFCVSIPEGLLTEDMTIEGASSVVASLEEKVA
ncbi:acyl carrier protein [Segniliparus rugosus]|uniref:Acyl carrier protein n=1 Tax=Segniliparus rugosus (strain ATCC BAA-974 / DSM 45345 / CCUG 50838 / CIP 108380 / JCM 13579 / CDC 945) TaxID=679197 RepID=E5XKT2_SEGRC|nr:acyl carrier protein [Segniliparus rugosus]EFV15045.1 acyl carrier protein [Segniliparus rugosus ATCC BAA-974]